MRYILFILSILLISPIFAQGIQWETDLNKAYDKSTSTNKPMLVYFTMNNCTYCKMMEGNTLQDSNFIKAVRNVIPVKLRYEINQRDVKNFKVTGFPTTFIVNPKPLDNKRLLDVKYKRSGYISASELINKIQSLQGQ